MPDITAKFILAKEAANSLRYEERGEDGEAPENPVFFRGGPLYIMKSAFPAGSTPSVIDVTVTSRD